jgi:hypothetical protein
MKETADRRAEQASAKLKEAGLADIRQFFRKAGMEVDGAGEGGPAPTDALSDLELMDLVRDMARDLPEAGDAQSRKRNSKFMAQGERPPSPSTTHTPPSPE